MQPRDSSLGSKYTNSAFAAESIFGIFRSQGTRLVATNVVSPCRRELTALPQMSAAFEGHFEGEEKVKKRKGRKGTEGMGENTSSPSPHISFL